MADGLANASFAITLPKGEAAVEHARLALLDYLEPFALDDRVINRIEVVLEELVSNVVRHAAEADTLSVAAERAGDAVTIAVEDNGKPFNPFAMSEHATFNTLDDAQLGGLGIPLIKRLSRSARYERVGDSNRVTLEIAAA